jgi:hypothetical protein
MGRNRFEAFVSGGSGFDFDGNNGFATGGDDVDFPHGRFVTLSQDAIKFQTQDQAA